MITTQSGVNHCTWEVKHRQHPLLTYNLVNCADDCAVFRQIVFRPFPKYSARDPLASDLSPRRSAAGQGWEGLFSKTHQGQRLKVYFRITSEKGRGKCFLTTTDNNGHKLILQQKACTQLASLNAHQYLFESLASVWTRRTPCFLAPKCPSQPAGEGF